MFDNYLTADQKRSLIEQRLTQFAAEGYQHQLNKLNAQTATHLTAEEQAQAIEVAEKSMDIIQQAIATHEVELGKL